MQRSSPWAAPYARVDGLEPPYRTQQRRGRPSFWDGPSLALPDPERCVAGSKITPAGGQSCQWPVVYCITLGIRHPSKPCSPTSRNSVAAIMLVGIMLVHPTHGFARPESGSCVWRAAGGHSHHFSRRNGFKRLRRILPLPLHKVSFGSADHRETTRLRIRGHSL